MQKKVIRNKKVTKKEKDLFSGWLQKFTELHINLLKEFAKDLDNGDFSSGGLQLRIRDPQTAKDIIIEQNEYLKEHQVELFFVANDLYEEQLLKNKDPLEILASFGRVKKQTTSLADDFLDFISEYESEDER